MSLFKAVRIFILLVVLAIVAGNHFLGAARLATWDRTVWITVYPIPADNKPETRRYIANLRASSFDEIGTFFTREASRYGLSIPDAAHFQLAPIPFTQPPALPQTDNPLAIGWWSLRMRWWAWRQEHQDGLLDPDIQVFIRYRSVEGMPRLQRSVGLQKGRYTLVNAYASPRMASRNRFVVAHELLHVFGATDKYDYATGHPIPPDGLADPNARPLFPQRRAEIMGGYIAVSPRESRMPASLAGAVVGPMTAGEIGWLAQP
ncbi:MAG: hypothetical protein AAGH19_09695 [Pseudomonadota bacterium]